jgi:hypothetical protein
MEFIWNAQIKIKASSKDEANKTIKRIKEMVNDINSKYDYKKNNPNEFCKLDISKLSNDAYLDNMIGDSISDSIVNRIPNYEKLSSKAKRKVYDSMGWVLSDGGIHRIKRNDCDSDVLFRKNIRNFIDIALDAMRKEGLL